MKVIIVGGVAAGASCAARLRRLDEYCEIIMFEKGEYISFANCGLPYYVGGVIKEREKLLVQTPESFRAMLNVDVRTFSEVVEIDRENKTVTVYDSVNDIKYQENYDKLVLAQGAKALELPIPGIESEKIFGLRTVGESDKLKAAAQGAKSAVVVGGGFTGVEIAENLRHVGIEVTLVEAAKQVLAPMDADMAEMIHSQMRLSGVELVFEDAVQSFETTELGVETKLSSGKVVASDFVVFVAGTRPETELAKNTGLDIGKAGGVLVDRNLKTSDDDIYAIGDMIEVKDIVSETKALIPMAGIANKQGRIVADNLAGINSKFSGAQGTLIIKVFDITVAATGNNEKSLQKRGVEYKKVYTQDFSHASYYPMAFPMTLKLLFSDEGRILGAQIIGKDGVDKRIDVIAAMIRQGKTVHDLVELELAYAPPYGSAKDPVNVVGMVAENMLSGKFRAIYAEDLDKLENPIIVDVRSTEEFALGAIEGAINIPFDTLRARISELPRTRNIVLYCAKGQRSYFAYRVLAQYGFENLYGLSGGYSLMKRINLIEPAGKAERVEKVERVEFEAADEIAPEVAEPGVQSVAPVEELKEEPLKTVREEAYAVALEVDACALQCPGPVMKLANAINSLQDGEILEIMTTDSGFVPDAEAWCESTGNTLLQIGSEEGIIKALIQKGAKKQTDTAVISSNKASMVVFSNDLDKAIASFIIANGARAAGKDVTMFFTFWGINILRKHAAPPVKKDFLSKMFGMMMPKGAEKLALSKMHMSGLGTWLMKLVMRKKNIATLSELIAQARLSGVNFVVCQMSMDVMGIQPEELIDGVEFAGVAKYINAAENAFPNLFI